MAVISADGAVAQFKTVSNMPVVRQLSLLVGLAAAIALGVAVAFWSKEGNYAPLYGELSAEDANAVVQMLDQEAVPYEMNHRTGMISVPADEVHRLRMKLAGSGLPRGDGKGFEILYQEQEIGISSFMENARYNRALEQELSRTISAMESVKSARVHLAIPKQSAFVQRDRKAQASVMVNLYPGRELTEQQLAGIAHMVSASVPGMEVKNVSVVDQRGRLLSDESDKGNMFYSQEQFRLTQQLEDNYVDRIMQILSPMVGDEGVRAQVTADIDFSRTEKTSEIFAPEVAVRSEQLVEELTGAVGAGGIPGTLSNRPPVESVVTENAGTDGSNATVAQSSPKSKREVRNYEVDRTISHVREAPGLLKRLSVAVVVDYRETFNEEGVAERQPITQEELDRMTQLVKDAVGFNAMRGDSVNIVNASFVQPAVAETLPEPTLIEQDWFWKAVRYASGAVAFLLLLFVVIKPLTRVTPVAGKTAGALPAGQGAEGEEGEDRVTLSGPEKNLIQQNISALQEQLNLARSLAAEQPERVAHVVKNWITADE